MATIYNYNPIEKSPEFHQNFGFNHLIVPPSIIISWYYSHKTCSINTPLKKYAEYGRLREYIQMLRWNFHDFISIHNEHYFTTTANVNLLKTSETILWRIQKAFALAYTYEATKKKKQKILDVLTLLSRNTLPGQFRTGNSQRCRFISKTLKKSTQPEASSKFIFSLSFPIAVRVDSVANGSSNNATEKRFGSFVVVSYFSALLFEIITSFLPRPTDRPTPFPLNLSIAFCFFPPFIFPSHFITVKMVIFSLSLSYKRH